MWLHGEDWMGGLVRTQYVRTYVRITYIPYINYLNLLSHLLLGHLPPGLPRYICIYQYIYAHTRTHTHTHTRTHTHTISKSPQELTSRASAPWACAAAASLTWQSLALPAEVSSQFDLLEACNRFLFGVGVPDVFFFLTTGFFFAPFFFKPSDLS